MQNSIQRRTGRQLSDDLKLRDRGIFTKDHSVDCKIHMKHKSSVNRNPDSSAHCARNEEQTFPTCIINTDILLY